MKISIIIPFHNENRFDLMKCIQSVTQSPNSVDLEIELLLCNDHSNSDCRYTVQKMAETDQRIRIIDVSGYGVSAARNAGLDEATGDIIAFCDSDDLFSPIFFSEVRKAFYDNRFSILVGKIERFASNTELERKLDRDIAIYHSYFKEKNDQQIINAIIWNAEELAYHVVYDSEIMGSVCNKVFTKEVINGIRFNETLSMCEDTEFLSRVLISSPDIFAKIVNDVIYYYRINLSSATNDYKRLYHPDGQLIYYDALNKIIKYKSSFKRMKGLVKSQMAYLAMQPSALIPSKKEESCLRKCAIRYYPYIVYLWMFNKKEMIKRLILIGEFIVLGGKIESVNDLIRSKIERHKNGKR